jgi:starvation-inducible DNA-binding protein
MANGHTARRNPARPWQSATAWGGQRASAIGTVAASSHGESNERKGETLGQELIEHTLDEKTRHAIAADLQGALVDLVAMSLTAKQAHWVVVGPQFRSVHLELDELVETTRAAADDVAERASALGRVPNGMPATIARSSEGFALPEGFLEDRVILASIANQITDSAKRMRLRIERIDALDPLSGDLLMGITRDLEKHAWMIQAAQYRGARRGTERITGTNTTVHA